MANINWGDILSKAEKSLAHGETKKKLGKLIDTEAEKIAEAAASKFISVMRSTINTSSLSDEAKGAISDMDSLPPQKVGDGRYIVNVSFDGDMHRDSLDPSRYPDGIDDLIQLLDEGVDHKMHTVSGEWHGVDTLSKTVIPGVHFIKEAVDNFQGNYGAEFNVIDVHVNKD